MAVSLKALLILGVVAALFAQIDARTANKIRRQRNVNATEGRTTKPKARYGGGFGGNNCQGFYDCMGKMEVMSRQVDSLKAEQSTLLATMTSVNKKALEHEKMLHKLIPQNKRLRHELEHLSEEYEEREASLIEKINTIAELEEAIASLQRKIEEINGMCFRSVSVDVDDLYVGEYGIYYISDGTTDYSWWEAQNFCRQNGMHLVSIESDEEMDDIYSEIEYFYEGVNGVLTSSEWYWIGLNNYESEDDYYTWIGTGYGTTSTASDHSFEYDNWGPDQPSTDLYPCVGMYNDDDDVGITWYDLDCVEQQRFICEVPPVCYHLMKTVLSVD